MPPLPADMNRVKFAGQRHAHRQTLSHPWPQGSLDESE